MLNIYLGDVENEVYNTSMYFDHTYMDSWFEDELSLKIIKSVDKAQVIANRIFDSAALGPITATQLSGGTKTLLLMRHDKTHIFNASTCGDNCSKWILKIAKDSEDDVNITLHHIMDFGNGKFEARIMNNDTIIHSMEEFVVYAGKLLWDGE